MHTKLKTMIFQRMTEECEILLFYRVFTSEYFENLTVRVSIAHFSYMLKVKEVDANEHVGTEALALMGHDGAPLRN